MTVSRQTRSAARYIDSTSHAESLSAALDAYCRALTRRWRELIADSIDGGAWEGIPEPAQGSMWDFTSPAARAHIDALKGPAMQIMSACHYLNWVRSGQRTSLESVTCDGWTGDAPRMLAIPQHIACGVGSILAQVEDWAYAERQAVFEELPLFDRHDLSALERAHDSLIEIGAHLGLEAGDGSAPGVLAPFGDAAHRDIPVRVTRISGEHTEYRSWWAGWTGLAADTARDGFFASVTPTMDHQAAMAGWLANLYTTRAAIIEKGRNDALYWIQWATGSLDQTELGRVDLRNGWKSVQGIGMLVEATLGWSGAGAATGATVGLLGFLGENVLPGGNTIAYANDMWAVMSGLRQKIGLLNIALGQLEESYSRMAAKLDNALYNTHSYNLELYDLSPDAPADDPEPGKGDHVSVIVDDVLAIAAECYHTAELHAPLLPMIRTTSEADPHLADKDGSHTLTDRRVTEMRDLLESFLQTTCARYVVAADQTTAAAKEYASEDEAGRARFEEIMVDWEDVGMSDVDVGFDPEESAQETERRGAPGRLDDSQDYITDEEREES